MEVLIEVWMRVWIKDMVDDVWRRWLEKGARVDAIGPIASARAG